MCSMSDWTCGSISSRCSGLMYGILLVLDHHDVPDVGRVVGGHDRDVLLEQLERLGCWELSRITVGVAFLEVFLADLHKQGSKLESVPFLLLFDTLTGFCPFFLVEYDSHLTFF